MTSTNIKKLADRLGFKALLAWHYIILFTPILADKSLATTLEFVFERQFTLYLSLSMTFCALAFFGEGLLRLSGRSQAALLHGIVGIFSILATLGTAAVLVFPFPTALQLIIIAALGCFEALSMYLWLHQYLESRSFKRRQELAIDMISGVIIAFFALNLQQLLSLIVIAGLPGLASLCLFIVWPSRCEKNAENNAVIHKSAERTLFERFLKNHLPAAFFAVTFGLVQGGMIQHRMVFSMAPTPFVLLGILISGIIIYLIRAKPGSFEDIDLMHRFALLLLVLGVLGLFILPGAYLDDLSQAALLAGFNLFDFGMLILTMDMVRKVSLLKAHFIDGGRALVYSGFVCGLAAGYISCLVVGEENAEALLHTIGGVAILLLVGTMLVPLNRKKALEAVLIPEGEERSAEFASARFALMNPASDAQGKATEEMLWHNASTRVAEAYQLSRRETEVFMLLAKGRNADYIQKKLVISLHTAKSHISNIYQKLSVHSIQEMLDLIELHTTK
jgi:DNA-binding CsgD family transcriptional regulator